MKPKLQGARRFTRSALLITAVLAVSLTVFAQDAPQTAIPMESVFQSNSLSPYDRPALSPDGQYLAYAIYKPTYVDEAVSVGYGFLEGTHLHLKNLETGEIQIIGDGLVATYAPSWSPDGTQLAYYAIDGEQLSLDIYDLATGTTRRLVEGVADDGFIGGEPAWHPNGQQIAVTLQTENVAVALPSVETTAPDAAQVLQFTTDESAAAVETLQTLSDPSELGLVDVGTGDVVRLTSVEQYQYVSDPRFSASGEWLLMSVNGHFTSEVDGGFAFDLAAVHLSDRAIYPLDSSIELPESQMFGETFLGWHPTQDRFFYFKQGRAFEVSFTGDAVSEPQALSSQEQTLQGNVLGIDRDGRYLFALIAPTAAYSGINAIQVLPLDGGTPSVLNLPANLNFSTIVKANGLTVWQPKADTLTIIGFDETNDQSQWVRFDLTNGRSEVLSREQSLFSGIAGYFTGAPANHNDVIATYQNFSTPVTLARLDADATTITPLVVVDERNAYVEVGQVEFFQTPFTDEQGIEHTLSAALMLPPGTQVGDDLPVIVEQYGGADLSSAGLTYGGGLVGSIPASVFTTRGYAVLMVDIPLVPEGQEQDIRTAIASAVVAQVEQAIALKYIHPERLAVTGQSFGGYGVASVLSATDLFKAGVAVAGIYDLPNTYAWDLDDFGIYWSEEGQGRMGASLWDSPERYIENSPYFYADEINTPLLLVHGEQDTTCAYQEAQKMFIALRHLDRDVEFLLYPRGGHVITEWPLEDAIDVTERILEFLDKHLN